MERNKEETKQKQKNKQEAKNKEGKQCMCITPRMKKVRIKMNKKERNNQNMRGWVVQ